MKTGLLMAPAKGYSAIAQEEGGEAPFSQNPRMFGFKKAAFVASVVSLAVVLFVGFQGKLASFRGVSVLNDVDPNAAKAPLEWDGCLPEKYDGNDDCNYVRTTGGTENDNCPWHHASILPTDYTCDSPKGWWRDFESCAVNTEMPDATTNKVASGLSGKVSYLTDGTAVSAGQAFSSCQVAYTACNKQSGQVLSKLDLLNGATINDDQAKTFGLSGAQKTSACITTSPACERPGETGDASPSATCGTCLAFNAPDPALFFGEDGDCSPPPPTNVPGAQPGPFQLCSTVEPARYGFLEMTPEDDTATANKKFHYTIQSQEQWIQMCFEAFNKCETEDLCKDGQPEDCDWCIEQRAYAQHLNGDGTSR